MSMNTERINQEGNAIGSVRLTSVLLSVSTFEPTYDPILIFTARRYASALLAVVCVCLSVCLCVCPSVTSRLICKLIDFIDVDEYRTH